MLTRVYIKPVRQLVPDELGLIGFVFFVASTPAISINPCYHYLNVNLSAFKLALFFHINHEITP